MLNIGCHVSSSFGYVNMLEDTIYIGGNTFQWFTRNPRGGAAKELYNQYKKHFTGYITQQSEPIGSKVDRAQGFKQALMQGKIRFVLNDNQRELLLTQLKGFPLAKHDDLIDALSYAYSELSTNTISGAKTAGKRKRKRIR